MSDVPAVSPALPADAPAPAGATHQPSSVSSPSRPAAAAVPRRPGDPPTRERKLNAVSFEQVDAARSLIRPQPAPRKRDGKVVFPPDATPADAGAASQQQQPPPPRRKPGPLPRSAPPDQHGAAERVRQARAAISPRPAASPGATGAAGAAASPELAEEEMEQIVRLVQEKHGPILDIEQASQVSRLAKQTIRERVCRGMYADSVVRGRPLRFWTHRFVRGVMRP